jgi:hypothetical protein
MWECKSDTHTKQQGKLWSCTIMTFLDTRQDDKNIMNWKIASISWISSSLNFYMIEILICWHCSQIFEVCYCLTGSIRYVSLYYNAVLHSGDKKRAVILSAMKFVTKRKQRMMKVTGNGNFSGCDRLKLRPFHTQSGVGQGRKKKTRENVKETRGNVVG